MLRVDSSSLAEVGYDVERRHLYVRFVADDALFLYRGVPPAMWEALLAAPSKGAYFNRVVRSAFEWSLVDESGFP